MPSLPTKSGRSSFRYERHEDGSLHIEYGGGKYRAQLTAEQWDALLREFAGRSVPLGSSRDTARAESVGAWLQRNVTKTAIASYVGPIRVHEGHASWGGGDDPFQAMTDWPSLPRDRADCLLRSSIDRSRDHGGIELSALNHRQE